MSVFFLPMIAMIVFTVFPTVDLLRGVIAGILFTSAYYSVWRVMPVLDPRANRLRRLPARRARLCVARRSLRIKLLRV